MSYIKEYNDYVSKIVTRKTEVEKEISQLDLAQQDILHYLEFEKCSAATSAKLMKKLKLLRIERRKVKNEHDELNKICTRMGSKKIEDSVVKKYTYRTDIVKEVVGR